MFCPDTEAIKEFMKVKNSYVNTYESSSIKYEIIKCTKEKHGDKCKKDMEILYFL